MGRHLVVIAVLLVGNIPSAMAQYIGLQNRISNASPGVCWWACADMVAREYGIKNAVGIRDHVLKDGRGRDSGARVIDIDHWKTKLGFDCQIDKSNNVTLVKNSLKAGKPVIVSMRLWEDTSTHALILMSVSPTAENWRDGKGLQMHDYLITYIDPNDHKYDYTCTWTWFTSKWTGYSYLLTKK